MQIYTCPCLGGEESSVKVLSTHQVINMYMHMTFICIEEACFPISTFNGPWKIMHLRMAFTLPNSHFGWAGYRSVIDSAVRRSNYKTEECFIIATKCFVLYVF